MIAALLTACNGENKNYSNEAFTNINLYLKEIQGFELSPKEDYVVCFLYCVHCGNCSSKLNKQRIGNLAKKKNAIFIVDVNDIYAIYLQSKKTCKVFIDKDASMYSYGLEGTKHRAFYFSKGKMVSKEILD